MLPESKNNPFFDEQRFLSSKERNIQLRARVIQSLRHFFIKKEYLEVETPQLIPAPAPECHIDSIAAEEWFLHTSPELCMKRLLAAGYPKIFQISKCFRKGERGGLHLPEFTLLEWYRTKADYEDLMEECEEMILFIAEETGFGQKLIFNEYEIDIKRPWERISVSDAFKKYTEISMMEAYADDLFDELMVEKIEPNLGVSKPCFIHDYPTQSAPLAKPKSGESGLAERFELYMGGIELANAFTELTDAQKQRERFENEQDKRREMGKDVYPMPENFLKALDGVTPSAGIALGVDRLIMILANARTVDEVVAFTPEML